MLGRISKAFSVWYFFNFVICFLIGVSYLLFILKYKTVALENFKLILTAIYFLIWSIFFSSVRKLSLEYSITKQIGSIRSRFFKLALLLFSSAIVQLFSSLFLVNLNGSLMERLAINDQVASESSNFFVKTYTDLANFILTDSDLFFEISSLFYPNFNNSMCIVIGIILLSYSRQIKE